MTVTSPTAQPSRATILRRALLVWGLGDLALGRRVAGIGWLGAELLAAALLAYLVIGLADTTWYLVPFLAGIFVLAAWAGQAIAAYRAADDIGQVNEATPRSSPAAALAWLSLPLLVWGAGFWLVAGEAGSPAAVVDRFESGWPAVAGPNGLGGLDPVIADRQLVFLAARDALSTLQRLCAEGSLSRDCSATTRNLLRDVRITVSTASPDSATAVVQVVSFERRPSRFMGIFATTELVPVPRETVLTLVLRALPAPLPGGLEIGAQRWGIVNAATP